MIGRQEFDAAEDVLVATAQRMGCKVAVYGQDYSAHEEFNRLVYQDEFGLADLPLPRLPGRHRCPTPLQPFAPSRPQVSMLQTR